MVVQLIVASGSKAGQAIPITGDKFIIGRADDCHLKPRSELISRYHCAVISEDGYVAIRDLGSKNGVYLNGERVALESELKNGDKLSVGPLEFIVSISIGTKLPKKPKVDSVEAAVVRTVEIEAEHQKKEKEQLVEKPYQPTAQTIAVEEDHNDGGGLSVADWLLGSSDRHQIEAETKIANPPREARVEVFVPEHDEIESSDNSNKTTDTQKTDSKINPQKAASSRDAAANLLKNFFKGGR